MTPPRQKSVSCSGIDLELFFGVTTSTQGNKIIHVVRFAIAIRDYVMHLKSFRAATLGALMTIAFKRVPPMQLPFLVVRGHLPAAPKVALRSSLNFTKPSVSALHRACFLVARYPCSKSFLAYQTCSGLLKRAIASKPIAHTRAESGCWPALFRVECVAALLAGAIFSQLWLSSRAFQSLVPRRWGGLCSVASLRTIFSFLPTDKLYAACDTGVEYSFHAHIIPHMWLDSRNLDLAHDRIGRSQPLLLQVTA